MLAPHSQATSASTAFDSSRVKVHLGKAYNHRKSLEALQVVVSRINEKVKEGDLNTN